MTAFPLAPLEALPPSPQHGTLVFALERPQDAAGVDDLIDQAFGPGRFAKTAERLREGNQLRADLSICAWEDRRLVGVVRQWPILVGDTRAVFLGPFAVDAGWRGRKLGRVLIDRAVALNDIAGERLTILVGAQSYFGPSGFELAPPGRLTLPGPVDPRRLMWRGMAPTDLIGVAGAVQRPR